MEARFPADGKKNPFGRGTLKFPLSLKTLTDRFPRLAQKKSSGEAAPFDESDLLPRAAKKLSASPFFSTATSS